MITIPEFYNNRDVFITGATGFVGKVLIEKLLRSCPGIRRIFLMLRPKRTRTISARMEEIKNTPVSYFGGLEKLSKAFHNHSKFRLLFLSRRRRNQSK